MDTKGGLIIESSGYIIEKIWHMVLYIINLDGLKTHIYYMAHYIIAKLYVGL